RGRELDVDARGRLDQGRLDDDPCDLVGVEVLVLQLQATRVEPGGKLAREQQLVDDRREPVGLLGNELEQLRAPRRLERREALLKGERRSVNRRERGPQL